MNRATVKGPGQSGLSPCFRLKIRGKTSMAHEAVVLSGSDVDKLPSNDAAKPASWRRQVRGSSVDPSPVHPTAIPSPRRLRRWIAKINALKNRISSPAFSSLGIFSLARLPSNDAARLASWRRQVTASSVDPSTVHPAATPSHKRLRRWIAKINALKNNIATPAFSSRGIFSLVKKEAGDVDLVCRKANRAERREDDMDQSPQFTENVPSLSEHGRSRLLPPSRTKSRDVDGYEDDGVPVPTRRRIAHSDNSLGVDSVFYDYEGSHCVDDINRLGVEAGICQCVEFPSAEHSHSVDPHEEYCDPAKCHQRAETAGAPNEHFWDSDVLSWSIDAAVGRQASRDWQPHEAETILSDIYKDLGEVCICLVEDGCICSLEECQCPDQDVASTKAEGMETSLKANEDTPQKANSPEQSTPPANEYRATQQQGTSTGLYTPSFYSDQMLKKKAKRRKNNKLSERVICKRKMSPKYYETEVDPKKCDLEEAAVATRGTLHSDEAESVDPPPSNTSHKTSCMKGTFLQTKVTPDVFYSEDYSTGVDELPATKISVGDSQLLLDCIAAADDSISKAQRAQVDDFEKSPDAEAQFPIKSQTEVSEDGISCQTEVKSRSIHGTLTKTDVLAFRTHIVQHVEDENANKYSSDISKTSCDFRTSADSFNTEIRNVFSARNNASGQTNDVGDKEDKNVTLNPKPSSSNTRSTDEMFIPPLRKNKGQLCAAQVKETVTQETSPNAEREVPASNASSKMPDKGVLVSRIPSNASFKMPAKGVLVSTIPSNASLKMPDKGVLVSRIPKRLSKKTPEKSTGEQKEASEEAISICHIKSTQSRSSNFSSTTTQSKESGNKIVRTRSYTKISHASNSQCTPTFEENDSTRADEEKKFADTTTTGIKRIKPYVPQMITFYKHKDAKVATTIPPPSPKSRKITHTTPKPELPDWNGSTTLEKPRKCNRPPRLLSKRHNSVQSFVKASSESSKQSLSSAIIVESADGLSSSLSESTDIGRSLSECDNCPQQSRSQKTDKVGSSPPKQPFRPAGMSTGTRNDRRKIIPVSNTARSHPDLRLPRGRVDVPVVYPSTTSETSPSTLMKETGTKRAEEKGFDNDCKKANIKLNIYPHTFLETGLGANSFNSAAWDAKIPLLTAFHPRPAPKMFLFAKSAMLGPKNQKNVETKLRRSVSTPTINNLGQVSRLGQNGRTSPKPKPPVPYRE